MPERMHTSVTVFLHLNSFKHFCGQRFKACDQIHNEKHIINLSAKQKIKSPPVVLKNKIKISAFNA